jgi:hypothetical protein
MVKLSATATAVGVGLLLMGCGGGANSHGAITRGPGLKSDPWYIHGGPSPMVDTRRIVLAQLPHLGRVLIDGHGHTLYAFVPDRPGASCAGACTGTWPPFTLTPEHVLDTSPSLGEELIAVTPKEHFPERTRVVSYGGWLLHSYTGDTAAWVAHGQGVSSYGGHWYVVAPSGKPHTKNG